jgi:hypothetical protein
MKVFGKASANRYIYSGADFSTALDLDLKRSTLLLFGNDG